MTTIEDYDFSSAEAGASDTIPMEAGQIRKGGLIMIKGQPCKVVEVSTSKTGKHGHAKCNFIATNIFNSKKLEDMLPSTHGTTVPVVLRTEYTLVDINDENFMTLMSEDGNTREDLQLPELPEGYADTIRAEFDGGNQLILTVLKACGHEQVMSHKLEL
jgi:translation initiation factor 5A